MAEKTALVLGATGGIGGEMARTLRARGWRVRAMHRSPEERDGGIKWVQGDAMVASDVARAAEGAALIVHAVNPPGYRNWGKLVLPMIDNTIAAAKAAGATILLPGTVYNYGSDAFPLLTEASPQHPETRKGAIRVEMERRLAEGASAGAPAIVVRAGDFFGPRSGNNWFAQLVKPGRPLRSITAPGTPGVGHQWSYLPDVAETMMRVVEAGVREPFATFHMAGHWDPDGTAMSDAIRRAAGAELPVRRFPWPLVRLAQPFVPLFREVAEMRYLWQEPLRMANDKLVATIGDEPHTPLDEAVRTTLEGLGCLPAQATAGPSVEATV
jgi:nucleoside-diphosphate-sugar epimerase